MKPSNENIALQFALTQFNAEYAAALDGGSYDLWPEYFTEECLYQVMPKENYDLGLPIALIHCESKGMLKDRVNAVKDTVMAEPRSMRHFVTNTRVVRQEDGVIYSESNVLLVETMIDRMTEVVLSGRFVDQFVTVDDRLLLKQRICVTDTLLIPTSLVVPV